MREGTVALGYLDDGSWKAVFGFSRSDMLMRDLVGARRIVCNKELRVKAHPGGLAQGRNTMVRNFLDDTNAEWLFMVDSDMGFDEDSVDRLLVTADPVDRPIVGGLCFALGELESKNYKSTRYEIIPTIYEYASYKQDGVEWEVGFVANEKYPRNDVVRVAATGAAFLLIHRDSLVLMQKKYNDNWFSPTTHPTGDQGRPRIFSEDFSFFLRCAQVGLPVYVDTSVKTVHIKGALNLDEDLYDDYSLKERDESV